MTMESPRTGLEGVQAIAKVGMPHSPEGRCLAELSGNASPIRQVAREVGGTDRTPTFYKIAAFV